MGHESETHRPFGLEESRYAQYRHRWWLLPDFLGGVGLGLRHVLHDVMLYLSNAVQVMFPQLTQASLHRRLVYATEACVAVLQTKTHYQRAPSSHPIRRRHFPDDFRRRRQGK